MPLRQHYSKLKCITVLYNLNWKIQITNHSATRWSCLCRITYWFKLGVLMFMILCSFFTILFCNLLKIEYHLISIRHPQALGPSSNENKDCPTPTYDLDFACENRLVELSVEMRIRFVYRKIYNISLIIQY